MHESSPMRFIKLFFLKLVMSLFLHNQAYAAGVVVLAGGGEDGQIGDKSAWSYQLYKRLIENGDINGDGKVKVVVLSYYQPDSEETPEYFKSLGASSAEHVIARNRQEANDPKIVDKIRDADVIFFRGGDQAEYYRSWKNTRLFDHIKHVDQNGGALGGTSAGAMSLAGYALAGGQEIGSKDVLSDGQSKLLDDELGGSSIHNDFIGAVPGAYVDTHCGERARLGRLLGVHAKASEDFGRKDLLGICVAEQTGVAIANGKAQIYGKGMVEFIQQTPQTRIMRKSGKPLVYTDIRNDALTEGWVYDMQSRRPETSTTPSGTRVADHKCKCGQAKGQLTIDGSRKADESKFEYYPQYGKENYLLLHSHRSLGQLKGVVGITRAHNYDDDPSGGEQRAKIQAALYRAIYDEPGRSAILLAEDGVIRSVPKREDVISFERNSRRRAKENSAIILDCAECTHTGLSPRVTELDNGSKTLRAPALINLRVHVIGASTENDVVYNLKSHQVESTTAKPVEVVCQVKSEREVQQLKEIAEEILGGCEK